MRRLGRMARWLLPVLIVIQLASALVGFRPPLALLPVLVRLEVLLTAIVVVRLALAARTARRQRRSNDPWETTLEATIAGLTPGLVAGLVVSEVRVFVTLGQWLPRRLTRRPLAGFVYHRDLILIGWAMLFALSGPAEMTLLHILIPWATVRWVVLALEIYGLLWLLAIGVSFGSLRHRVSAETVRLRLGLLADIVVPVLAIKHVTVDVHRFGRNLGPDFDGDEVMLTMNGRTNLVMELTEPVRVRRLFGRSGPVRTIRFHADDPATVLAALNQIGVAVRSEIPAITAMAGARS